MACVARGSISQIDFSYGEGKRYLSTVRSSQLRGASGLGDVSSAEGIGRYSTRRWEHASCPRRREYGQKSGSGVASTQSRECSWSCYIRV